MHFLKFHNWISCLFALFCFLQAQNSVSITVENQLPVLHEFSVLQAAVFPVVLAKDIDIGYIDAVKPLKLQISSNVNWQLVATVPQGNLYLTPGQYKSVQSMQWKAANKTYKSFTNTGPTIITQGEAGVHELSIDVFYRLLLNWKDSSPGQWMFTPQFSIQPL